MTDRDRYHLRGPVQSVRFEFAVFDAQAGEWEPIKSGPAVTFDREGQEEGRPARPPVLATVDERGMKTTEGSWMPLVPRPQGLEYGIGFDGPVEINYLTHYDDRSRPIEIVMRNRQREVQRRILLAYDDDGRIASEQVLMGDSFGLGEMHSVDATASDTPPPTAEQREQLIAMLKAVLPDSAFMTREYVYDRLGRVVQLLERMGLMQEGRRSFTYDGHDNVLEEHYQSSHRELNLDEEGRLVASNEASEESWTRYESMYDERGNFVERVCLSRVAPGLEFQRASLERRTLTYFDDQ